MVSKTFMGVNDCGRVSTLVGIDLRSFVETRFPGIEQAIFGFRNKVPRMWVRVFKY